MHDWFWLLLPIRGPVVESGWQHLLRESEITVTFPDPYNGGAGQEAVQPPPGREYDQPPPGQGYDQPGEAYGQLPPAPGFTLRRCKFSACGSGARRRTGWP